MPLYYLHSQPSPYSHITIPYYLTVPSPIYPLVYFLCWCYYAVKLVCYYTVLTFYYQVVPILPLYAIVLLCYFTSLILCYNTSLWRGRVRF